MAKLIIIFLCIGLGVFFAAILLEQKGNPPTTPLPSPSITPTPIPTPTPTPPPLQKQTIINTDVPFILQAPLGEWKDPRQQDACEEASIMMAVKWARKEKLSSPQKLKEELLQIADWQIEKFGDSRDTGASDTLQRIAKDYYKFNNAKFKEHITVDDIIQELLNKNLVITPMNGQALNNPFFTQPGPERHMILIIGFDANTNEFITNDPGIGRGKNYRYPVNVFFKAIRDYETGYHVPIVGEKKNMIIVSTKI